MKLYLVLILFSLYLVAPTQSGDAARKRNFNLDMGVALKEFDPVSYFHGKPARGTAKFEYDYKGITYFFVDEANREEFKKSPAKYEPAYGGWCAYTVATTGERVKIDPTSYKISDGKLYLFYNFKSDNRKLKWEQNEKHLKASADKHWIEKMH